jgi:hypothetical protein
MKVPRKGRIMVRWLQDKKGGNRKETKEDCNINMNRTLNFVLTNTHTDETRYATFPHKNYIKAQSGKWNSRGSIKSGRGD